MPILGIIAATISGNLVTGAMYWAGNQSTTTGAIGKMGYSTETTSLLSPTLATGLFSFGSVSNSPTACYFANIDGGTTTGVIQKLTYSGESVSTLSNYLTERQMYAGSGMYNSGTAGYWTGGYVTSIGYQNKVTKLLYSNDTTSLNAGVMPYSPFTHCNFSNNGVAGYAAGGRDPSFTTIAKMSFSSDTWSTLAAVLTVATYDLVAVANSGTAGYITGGLQSGGSELNTIQKVLYSNDTKSTLSATLVTAVQYHFGAANKFTAGYLYGGIPTGGGNVNSINKLTFSSETRSVLTATLPASGPLGQGMSGTNCGTF
jgi:hypothetical protein